MEGAHIFDEAASDRGRHFNPLWHGSKERHSDDNNDKEHLLSQRLIFVPIRYIFLRTDLPAG
jgi:hypothetical protein